MPLGAWILFIIMFLALLLMFIALLGMSDMLHELKNKVERIEKIKIWVPRE